MESKKMGAWIGIDPGKNGAAMVLTENDNLIAIDFDILQEVFSKLKEVRDKYDIKMAALEYVHAMPKQGISSAFKFGANYGLWHGFLIALKMPYILVTPQKWQKGVFKKEDGIGKERSLTVVRRMFPQYPELFKLKKHNDRADATLMAVYAKKQG